MYYIDYFNEENYVNEKLKDIKKHGEALKITNEESFNLMVRQTLIKEVYTEFLSFLEKVILINKKYFHIELNNPKDKISEIVNEIKIKINEVKIKLDKTIHKNIDLFNEVTDKDLTIYKRLIEVNKVPQYRKLQNMKMYRFSLRSSYEKCFGETGIYKKLCSNLEELFNFVDVYEKFINDSSEPFGLNTDFNSRNLPLVIKKSNGENDYMFIFTEFIKRLRNLYNIFEESYLYFNVLK